MTSDDQNKSDPNRTRRNVVSALGKFAGVIAGSSLFSLTNAKVAKAAPPCFLKGTMISTRFGECRVEDLQIGDLLPTKFGGLSPIKWVGRFSYKKTNLEKRWPRDFLPVLIRKSALAPNVPRADLFVTRAHALYIDDVLIPAGSLINGKTIVVYEAEALDELEFYHIRLDAHDVIEAEGAPCETLLSMTGNAENASNFADYYRLYGSTASDEAPCAPLLGFNGGRSEIKSRLRSAISPLVDRRSQLDIIRDRLEARSETFVLETGAGLVVDR